MPEDRIEFSSLTLYIGATSWMRKRWMQTSIATARIFVIRWQTPPQRLSRCLRDFIFSPRHTRKGPRRPSGPPVKRSNAQIAYPPCVGRRNSQLVERLRLETITRRTSPMEKLPHFDDADYSVVVKIRAPPPNSWRWEIYRAGRASPMGQSPHFFTLRRPPVV